MTTDYVAAATALAEGAAPEVPVVEAPVTPAAVETPAPAAAEISEPAPVSTVAAVKPEAKVDRVTKSFEDLAREKAAFRAEKEKLATGRATTLEAAAAKRDAIALLEAAGIPWKEAAEQILSSPGEKPRKEEPDARDTRLAALEQELASRREQEGREKVLSKLSARVAADPVKFKYVSGLKAEREAIGFLEQYYKDTGEMPGASPEESMEIALEAIETHHAKMAKIYAPLTGASGAATVPASKTAVPAVGAVSQQAPKTLTNRTGAGPSSASPGSNKPKTSEDYVRAAIEAATTAQ